MTPAARSGVRVAHVSSVHPWTDNRVHLREAASLADAGYDVSLIAVANDVDVPETGVKVRLLPRRSRLARVAVSGPQAVRLTLHERPHIVHLHDPELCWAIPLFRAMGTSIVYDAHEDLPKQVLGKGYLGRRSRRIAVVAARAAVRVAQAAHLLIGATESIAATFPQERTVVVRNYPRLDAASGMSDVEPSGADDGGFALIYAGGISERRGIRVMIEACDDALFPAEAVLHLYGPMEPPGLLDDIQSLPGWRRVAYHGVVSPARARHAISQSRLGLVLLQPTPAYVESLPTKLFEYLAEGCPAIVSDFPRWRQIVENHDCGTAVDPADASAIAAAVRAYTEQPDMYARQAQNARAAAHEHLNWASEERTLIGAYDRLVSARRPAQTNRPGRKPPGERRQ